MISVCIPAFNEEKNIQGLLNDLAVQIGVEREMIVADAASTDRTRQICEGSHVRVVDGGLPGIGRNRAARAARGDWLLFLDADVRLPSFTWLRDAVNECLRRRLDIAAVDLLPNGGAFIDLLLHRVYNFIVHLTARVLPHGAGACLFIRRELFERINGFDETITLAEDHDLTRRAAKHGHFGVLRVQGVLTSVRRLQKEGRWRLVRTYMRTEWHMLVHGPVRHGRIPYDLQDRSHPPRC